MRRRLPDLLILLGLVVLPLLFFWQQTLGGQTLLPTENLYQYEPYATDRAALGVPAVPHNALLSDLVLQNVQWKSFIRASFAQGELPLWNPHQFAGVPFLAAGQQSTFYPFSLLYYALPLSAAYGWFTVSQLWLAGGCMFLFGRGLGMRRPSAALAGLVYQGAAFFVVSAVFPMIIAAAAWLPLILLMTEQVIRQSPVAGRPASVVWAAGGALALGVSILAGHVEITYYTLIITAYYAAARLLAGVAGSAGTRAAALRWAVGRGAWLTLMIVFGVGLGAVQFVPLFELVSRNFRVGSASFEQVLGWAHPARDMVQFFMPNFYGNPSHHAWYDVFTGGTVPVSVNALGQPITVIDWGIKNYVEGALYLGILPLVLTLFALLDAWVWQRGARTPTAPPYRAIFALLGVFALTVMFGLPTYALLFYTLPGIDQLHSPFRWVFALTLSVAVLAGFGADALAASRASVDETPAAQRVSRWARRTGWALIAAGAALGVALLVSRFAYDAVAPLVERVFTSMAKATEAFPDARAFYSYQARNVLIFAVFLVLAGVVVRVSRSPLTLPGRLGKRPIWEVLALGVVALDLFVASSGFNPASDPAWLEHTPASIGWLREQPGLWRYTTLDDPAQPPLLNANMTLRYGLDDIRGYESIIPMQYVETLRQLAPQVQLEYNRIAPLYADNVDALASPLLDLLNVRYVVTHNEAAVTQAGWSLAYQDDAVRIWENADALPRAYVVADDGFDPDALAVPDAVVAAAVTPLSARELLIDVAAAGDGGVAAGDVDVGTGERWLVVSQSHFPGWRAFVRPAGAGADAETPAEVRVVQGNFVGVALAHGDAVTVRLVYSPQSFVVGAFGSFISLVALVFGAGVWAWRTFVRPPAADDTTTRVARNSLVPILLNLFNRGIDFAFAILMLRVLGAAGSGVYTYAVVVFGWFDIFTNFGLNLYLTREVARDRTAARHILANTSVLRLVLALVGVPLLLGFFALRTATGAGGFQAAPTEAFLTVALLYVGLIPNSLSTGMSALFYAFERAEVPAAIATVATFSKTLFGAAVLLAGFGVVGLAAVSILTNLITLTIMLAAGRALWRGEPRADAPTMNAPRRVLQPRLMMTMVRESYPLMLNHFLASIFFQIDIVLIEAIHGARMVGHYGVAYKWLAALNIIPSFFTQALLPVMARQAQTDRAALRLVYRLAIKLLLAAALPTAVAITFMAEGLTALLGGAEFLPDGAIALTLMIWSIPIGWTNSLTQYVLIALDLQRSITRAFAIAVTFNLATNALFIPAYGYRAAALTTIASEAVLFILFAAMLGRAVGQVGWWALVWRPLVAAGAMLGVLLVGWQRLPLGALGAAVIVYAVVYLTLRPFDADETARLTPMLPGRLRAWLTQSS